MQADDDKENFGKDAHNGGHLPSVGHIRKDPADVKRQKRNDDAGNEFFNDALEFVGSLSQQVILADGNANTKDERNEKGTHDSHQGRHINGKKRMEQPLFGVSQIAGHIRGNDMGKKGMIREKGQAASNNGGAIGNEGGHAKELTGWLTYPNRQSRG